MSTGHNRKRTQPRQCRAAEDQVNSIGRCPRFAQGASRYCSDHILKTESPEGPVGRALRLAHQANQVAEAGKLAGVTHVKLPRWYKEKMQKAKYAAAMQTFLQALVGVTFVEKVKHVAKKLNPWAK